MIPNESIQQAGLLGRAWSYFFTRIDETVESVRQSGTTVQRPTKALWTGRPYFDTTLGKPIWYEGPGWVDATGATA